MKVRRLGWIACLAVLLAMPVTAAWAHDPGHGRSRGLDRGSHRGLHVQDRIGRAFTSHFMLGSRFTAGDDAVNAHLHTTRTGRVFWHSEVPGESRLPVRHRRAIAFEAAPTVVAMTPFFCDPCAVGFVSATLFENHVHRMHGIPAADFEGSLAEIDGRLVFVGN